METAKIQQWAREVAEGAIDCFGREDVPTAFVAYSFLYQNAWDKLEGELPQMTRREFKVFKAEYLNQVRLLRDDRDTTKALNVMADEGLCSLSSKNLPDGDYTLTEGNVWLTVKGVSVNVRETEEGVSVYLYPLHGRRLGLSLPASPGDGCADGRGVCRR